MEFGIQDEIAQFNLIGALKILLADKTTGANIIWATDTYEAEGELFNRDREITPELVTFLYGGVIKNRTEKDASRQSERTRKRAEVFTPLWICKKMIDYIDDDFYGIHNDDGMNEMTKACHCEEPTGDLAISRELQRLAEAQASTRQPLWQAYVQNRRLEITCGEAPYLVSRYDVSTGERISIENRTGILDRKLRVISQNVSTRTEWFNWVVKAYQATYGYEFQGDSLLIARVNLLATFVEYYTEKWHEKPDKADIKKIANIIAWNIWQMDGLNCRVPYCKTGTYQMSLFDNLQQPLASPVFGEQSMSLRGEAEPRRGNPARTGKSPAVSPCTPLSAATPPLSPVLEKQGTAREVEKQPLCRIKNWKSQYTVNFNNLNEGKGKMKFDYIIGNPPYQEETENTSDKPVYNLFMDKAFELGDIVELIHPARFLFNAGKTPKEWNRKMLNDEHFKVLDYWADSAAVFSNVDIKGGVAITFRNASDSYGAIRTFTAYKELNSILCKVLSLDNFVGGGTLSNIIYNQNKFDLDKLYSDFPEYKSIIGSNGNEKRLTTSIFVQLDLFTEKRVSDSQIKIYGLIQNDRTTRYIERRYIEKHENLEYWKILVPKSNGSGALGEVLSTPLIGQPLIGHTQSFISIGAFETEKEAEACLKYVKTKFARAMLGILKVTQDNPPEKWKYVPLQDFTEKSDIDWSKSVAEIDRQLYKKYGLDEREISFIESKVKEMV